MKKIILISFILFYTSAKAQYVYEDNFDTLNQIRLVIDTTNNIWQIGHPHKVYFDSAYSASNAIVTDTTGYYPPNNESSFTFSINDSLFRYWDDHIWTVDIRFNHKFDTDTSADGGYITLSADGGASWQSIFIYNAFSYFENIYSQSDTIKGNIPAFSGHSNGWIQSEARLGFCLLSYDDSVMIRFNFKSDSINTNKEGWMIDNLTVGFGICEGVPAFNANGNNIEVYPNPATNQLTIHTTSFNNEAVTVEVMNVFGQMTSPPAPLLEERGDATIDVSGLSAGIYFVQLKSESTSVTKMFVKE